MGFHLAGAGTRPHPGQVTRSAREDLGARVLRLCFVWASPHFKSPQIRMGVGESCKRESHFTSVHEKCKFE